MWTTLVWIAISGASEDGKTGKSTSGCGNCHDGPVMTTVGGFESPILDVMPGEKVELVFRVETTDADHEGAGLNVSATGGLLGAGTNTKTKNSEIVHPEPAEMVDAAVNFDFTWTAPAIPGEYLLHGAANAVNLNGSKRGDGWSLAPDLKLRVLDCHDDDFDGVTDCEGDCDDDDGRRFPGNTEICDSVDNDCNTLVDDEPSDPATWHLDEDGDGYGSDVSTVEACVAPPDHVSIGGDCDDSDNTIHPNATESCDSTDDLNCDGSVGFADVDQDGHAACMECDDTDPEVHPGAEETCDDIDEDCDGDIDEDAVDTLSFYLDDDNDGFGDPDIAIDACDTPLGYVEDDTDCDDGDPGVNPGRDEVWYDGVDQDCDGVDDDQDGDGVPAGDDCDDTDATVQECPDAPVEEEPADGEDSGKDGGGGTGDSKGCSVIGTPSVGLAGLLVALGIGRRRF